MVSLILMGFSGVYPSQWRNMGDVSAVGSLERRVRDGLPL